MRVGRWVVMMLGMAGCTVEVPKLPPGCVQVSRVEVDFAPVRLGRRATGVIRVSNDRGDGVARPAFNVVDLTWDMGAPIVGCVA
jgi:hypothetical protein